MIKIAMADDHIIVRDGIKAVLERKGKDIELVGGFSNGKELMDFAQSNTADIYLVDISMPLLNGIETTRKLVKKNPGAKVIILSMYDDRVSVEKSLKAGAKGFVVKMSDTQDMLDAIEAVKEGKTFLSPAVRKYIENPVVAKRSRRGRRKGLTPKEKEILQLLAEGYSSKKMAEEYGLSVNTVHVHRNNIMRKLNIHKQADLIRYAIKEGIAHI